eukprot:TRINITY_DN12266_c0_g1_i2.p1 TRINITY_DN12266_c0_g1~~TRINITY_DN12266_c0_g1_i2.p1  ORF type:complete len:518 (-),score=109.95 TRINITY_DN12266_c0_g1_i2:73-1626(-)
MEMMSDGGVGYRSTTFSTPMTQRLSEATAKRRAQILAVISPAAKEIQARQMFSFSVGNNTPSTERNPVKKRQKTLLLSKPKTSDSFSRQLRPVDVSVPVKLDTSSLVLDDVFSENSRFIRDKIRSFAVEAPSNVSVMEHLRLHAEPKKSPAPKSRQPKHPSLSFGRPQRQEKKEESGRTRKSLMRRSMIVPSIAKESPETPSLPQIDNTAVAPRPVIRLRGFMTLSQGSLPGDNSTKLFTVDVDSVRNAENTLTKLTEKLQERLSKVIKEEFDGESYEAERKILAASDSKLSEYEVGVVRMEMSRGEDMDVDRIDAIVRRLKFFAQNPEHVRRLFLRSATFITHEPGATVFEQGDFGDLMYVILKGSVNVRVKRQNLFGKEESRVVASLYDGAHFGELAMMGTNAKTASDDIKYQERTRRAATIEAAERCHFLTVNRDTFKEIMLSQMQRQLDAKLKVLLAVSFLEKSTPFSLIPLANNLVLKEYSMGEIAVQEGTCLLYTSPSPRDRQKSRMPSSA